MPKTAKQPNTVASPMLAGLSKQTAKPEATSRKVWGVDLQGVWLPVFKASNIAGLTAIPAASLGAPLRLATDKDGKVRLSPKGVPVMKVDKQLSLMVNVYRDNFVASMLHEANAVLEANGDKVKALEAELVKVGTPILKADKELADKAIARRTADQIEAAMTETEPEATHEANANVTDKVLQPA